MWVWVRWRRLPRVAADLGDGLGGAAAWGGGLVLGERGARLRLDQAVTGEWGREMGVVWFVRFSRSLGPSGLLGTSRVRCQNGKEGGGESIAVGSPILTVASDGG